MVFMKKNKHYWYFVMKGYYENFCYKVYKVVIFLRKDSVTQKSILTYDEMVLKFFFNTIAKFVFEGFFISLCTVGYSDEIVKFYASSQLQKLGLFILRLFKKTFQVFSTSMDVLINTVIRLAY